MKWMCAVLAAAVASFACKGPTEPDAAPTEPLVVLNSAGQPSSGYDLLVNTDRGRTDWVTHTAEGLHAAYPPGQLWGFVAAVLSGDTAPGRRPGRDVSAYRTLQFQLRGAAGGESVEIGIKDNADRDDGTETKKTVVATASWQTYMFPLSDFTTADRTRVYLLFEIVFNGTSGRSVSVRDVRYLP